MSGTHQRIAARTPGPWTAVTFTNSWVNYGGSKTEAKYRKRGDMVDVRFAIKSGTLSTSAWTLPAGFRPPSTLTFTTTGPTTTDHGVMDVAADGTCVVSAPSNTLVSGAFSFSTTA
jgi:hypothetical protein